VNRKQSRFIATAALVLIVVIVAIVYFTGNR